MSEMKTVQGILDVIRSITSKRESGRLDISSFGTHGTLLFCIQPSLSSLHHYHRFWQKTLDTIGGPVLYKTPCATCAGEDNF